MNNIAILGHPTRGKEVIQILESLGGRNNACLTGKSDFYYYINHNGNTIECHDYRYVNEHCKKYTLEEFEKEFPFKIGDKVIDYEGDVATIIGFAYIKENLGYSLQYENGRGTATTDILKPYKEMEEKRNISITIHKAKEWYNEGGELRKIALQAYSEEELTEIKLPKSNVLKYILEDDSWFVVRPSGTEPKMKIYLSVVGKSLDDSEEKLNKFKNVIMKKINNILC